MMMVMPSNHRLYVVLLPACSKSPWETVSLIPVGKNSVPELAKPDQSWIVWLINICYVLCKGASLPRSEASAFIFPTIL
jgi:hypothetical protein